MVHPSLKVPLAATVCPAYKAATSAARNCAPNARKRTATSLVLLYVGVYGRSLPCCATSPRRKHAFSLPLTSATSEGTHVTVDPLAPYPRHRFTFLNSTSLGLTNVSLPSLCSQAECCADTINPNFGDTGEAPCIIDDGTSCRTLSRSGLCTSTLGCAVFPTGARGQLILAAANRVRAVCGSVWVCSSYFGTLEMSCSSWPIDIGKKVFSGAPGAWHDVWPFETSNVIPHRRCRNWPYSNLDKANESAAMVCTSGMPGVRYKYTVG